MNKVTTFLQEVIAELKKITWPSRKETIKMTTIVIITTIVLGAYIGSIDFGLTKMIEQIIN